MKIFLDACVIIYWIEAAEPHYSQFAGILQRLKKHHKSIIFTASHLSMLECRIKPLRDQNDVLLKYYQRFFCAKNLTLIPLDLDIIEKATELRAFYHLRTPDALQAASALCIPDDVIFVTGDAAFKKIPHLEILLIS